MARLSEWLRNVGKSQVIIPVLYLNRPQLVLVGKSRHFQENGWTSVRLIIYLEFLHNCSRSCADWTLHFGHRFNTIKSSKLCSPDNTSLRSFLKPLTSFKAVVTLSRPPNRLSRPRVRSMRKNMIDQNVAPGIWLMASVNAMNTNPGPLAAYR